ncbi:MAG: PLP-dependent aspartate aminotransferase family protein [Spirochaetaceae bacterium]|nr:PLP-dependent aspartate aminotransferase family protein [Spirochaetaceae bacterium]MCF7950720.1 PLP-dependent aspartate aminotransferase family protein [Spirochaetaceae bacterium]
MSNNKMKFDTQSIHAGGEHKNPENALNPPIFLTSTFAFENTDKVDAVMNFESDDYVYTRGNNPTLRLFENRMAELESGSGAVAFASGMAAISSVLFSYLRPGNKVLVHKTLYGSSYNVVTKVLPKYNIGHTIADLADTERLSEWVDEQTRVIYFETPSNPNLSIVDIKKVCEFARSRGIKVVIDNTFATPYFQRPLELGVDVVVHSATKYIGGHGDVVAGVAVSKDSDYIMSLKFDYMCEFGGVLSPFNAWLLLRGMKTLGLRMRQHESNAIAAAQFLQGHAKVAEVFYPGLKDFPGHEVARAQMDGFGAIVSFEVKGGLEAAKRVVNNTRLFKLAVSLGDCESLVQLPAAMTHRGYDQESLKQFGLSAGMIRLSLGLEHIDDILADLDQALAQA